MINAIKAFNNLLNYDPFDFSNEAKKAFLNSFKETANFHIKHCEHIKVFWDLAKIKPDDLKSEADLINIPPILVTIFKEFELISVPKNTIALTLTSSGTAGQKSLQHLNSESLDFVKKLAFKIHQSLGLSAKEKYNYLCFTYDPKIANDLGTAFTDELLTSFTGINEIFYAIRKHPETNEWFFDRDLCIETLWRFYESQIPIRILGFPAFLLDIFAHAKKLPKFSNKSFIQTGGGYKNNQNKAINKEEFRILASERLNIPKENIRDLFGMVEHGIPYVDDQNAFMRIPNYARVFTRDAKTLKPLKEGEVGLLHFICSYNTSYPASSLLTTDWGIVHKDPDGKGQILEIKGRAGVEKAKGCAISAQELLR